MDQRFIRLQPAENLPAGLTNAVAAERRVIDYAIENITATSAEIWLYDSIGGDGIRAGDFSKEIGGLRVKDITLRINSNGGYVSDAVAIFNAIRRHPANVTAYIDGMAASAASFIAMAADRVLMSPHSNILIHDAIGLGYGPQALMLKLADDLDKASNEIARIYSERAGGSVEEWRALMRVETTFSDQEAVDLGLADGIDGEDGEAIAARAAARAENALAEEIAETDIVEEDGNPIEADATDVAAMFTQLFDQITEDDALFAVA